MDQKGNHKYLKNCLQDQGKNLALGDTVAGLGALKNIVLKL